jgi:tRNA(Ile)-lysidine synthase
MAGSSRDIEALFAASVRRLTDNGMTSVLKPRLGLAVSGGPDSLTLMLLSSKTFPDSVRAATVDHGLRPEAADEAAYVASLCAERGIPHDILKPATPITGNLQSAAREARYRLLEQWADEHELDWIATAHHADDQLETLLMRIARGSGLAGLSSIREKNGRIIRPLLGLTKAELIDSCAVEDVVPCDDPSNANIEFDRVQIREWLQSAPALLDSRRVARTVGAVAEAHVALEWTAEQLAPQRIAKHRDGAATLDPQGLPAELLRRLLIRALQKVDPAIDPRGTTTDRALEALNSGQKITVGDILCTGGAIWRFEIAPQRRQPR